MREKKRKKKSWKKILLVVLLILLLLAVGALIVVKGFMVKKVVVTGNVRYTSEMIEAEILNDKYSWNSLYVYFKYKLKEPEAMPFVDTMEISLKSPQILEIKVYEKGLLGCVYMDALGQNAYFDKDGLVVEMSSDVIPGIPQITGLDVDQIVLYEKLPIKGKSVLRNLLMLTQTLKKYDLVPGSINYGKDGSYTLSYQGITVLLGQGNHLNEKVVRLSYIMPNLAGNNGTLHLESWTEDTTDITFEKVQ